MKIIDTLFKEIAFNLIDKFIRVFTLNKNSLRVLIFHDIQNSIQFNTFKKLISKLSKDYEFISPEEFEKFQKDQKVTGKKLLVTFDDGFISNIHAAKYLNKLNIKALFFIVSDFVGLSVNSKKYKKIISNIYPNNLTEDKLSKPLGNKDIGYLIKLGHTIGCHTSTHRRLSKLKNIKDLEFEVLKSKTKIETMFKIKIDHIAYPFGDFKSVDFASLKYISKHFNFIHSGLRGNNLGKKKLIKRDAINLDYKISRLEKFLAGAADLIYKRYYNKLNNYLN